MIKIPKKPSFKAFVFTPLISSILRTAVYTSFCVVLYIILPAQIILRSRYRHGMLFFLFFSLNLCLLIYLLRKHSARKNRLNLKIQDIDEQLNLLNAQRAKAIKNHAALEEKIRRYNSLKNIIEEISQNLSLETITERLCEIAFSLVSRRKGNCILYLVDPRTHALSLFKAKKEDPKVILKAKEGDIFDLWTLRHSSPLIVEDAKKDFRFDLSKVKNENYRQFSSLILAPLISENKFLGIMRLDNPEAGFYSQDDLRFLVTISELGAVAVENGELFQKTQDLAIHDGLTSLYTKGYFLERLKEESKRSQRHNYSLSLLMLDIDYFKSYNDKYGHSAGDIVLQKLSFDMEDFLKVKNPVISRFGGEEFCILLPRIDKQEALKIAQQLRARIEKSKIILRRQETGVTVSIGVAALLAGDSGEDELIIRADQAMYKAKQEGRNTVCIV